MPKFPSLKPSEIIRILIRNGFIIDRVKGSHHIMYNSETKRRVVVPFHKSDLPIGTLREIIKQSGMAIEDFTE